MQHTEIWPSKLGWQGPRWLVIVGIVSLLMYAIGQFIWPDFSKNTETWLAFTGLLAFCIHGKGLRRAPMILLLVFIAVQLLSWSLGLWQYPQWATDDPRLQDLAKLFIFISVAWWLGGSTRNTLIIWSLAALGFLIATLLAPAGNGWATGLTGQRVGFDIRNQQHASMLFGVTLLGLTCFARRFWLAEKKRALWVTVWGAGMVVAIAGIAVGQTRAVWLSASAAMTAGLALWAAMALLKGRTRRLLPYLAGIALSLAVVSGILAETFGDTLNHRFHKESGVVSQLMKGDIAEVPYTSIGIRINSWMAASQWIAERPLTGWGPEGRNLVMSETTWLPDWVLKQYGHLHNYFMETWVEYGLVGVLAMGSLAIWIGRATWLAWRNGEMPNDMACFGIVFFVYWMIINQFESYNSFSTGQFVHNLVVGGLITHYWRFRSKAITAGHAG